MWITDKKERYPEDKNLERDLYGLKRRLEEDSSKYVEEYFVEEYSNKEIGKIYITCYIFNTRIEGKGIKESKRSVRKEFFKNNMSVLFSLNGQVHGHYTSEFITRALKYQILRDYLLIHVDCTRINYKFRRELFMASRDRLKDSDESRRLREIVASTLRKGRLNEIYKRRRDSITLDAVDTPDLLKSFTKELPLNNELMKLLDKTFKLDEKRIEHKKRHEKDNSKYVKAEKDIFYPKRYPSFFKIKSRSKNEEPVLGIPLGGERTIQFDSDVENQYFVRVEYPGELKIALVNYKHNEDIEVEEGSSASRKIEEIEDAFDVVKKSPNQGTIKVILTPTKNIKVGDMVKIKATLTNPGNDFNQVFLYTITKKQKYIIKKMEGEEEIEKDLVDYIRDVFENYYSQFLLNFEISKLIDSIDE